MIAERAILAGLASALALAATPASATDNSKSHLDVKAPLAYDGGGGVIASAAKHPRGD